MAVWMSQILDVFICKIRKKLLTLGVDDFIETNWGRGYMVIDHRRDMTVPETALLPMPEDAARAIA
jgi:two-component system cell cycle response regulator CtrA